MNDVGDDVVNDGGDDDVNGGDDDDGDLNLFKFFWLKGRSLPSYWLEIVALWLASWSFTRKRLCVYPKTKYVLLVANKYVK